MAATAAEAQDTTGRFERCCDSVGFFLEKVEGAPAPAKLLLFLYMGFPRVPRDVPKEEWKDVLVYRDGCIAGGKCEVPAHGRVRLDDDLTDERKRISGKYEIKLGSRHLHGRFLCDGALSQRPATILHVSTGGGISFR